MLNTLPPAEKFDEEMEEGKMETCQRVKYGMKCSLSGAWGSASVVGGRNTFSSCVSVLVCARLTLTGDGILNSCTPETELPVDSVTECVASFVASRYTLKKV